MEPIELNISKGDTLKIGKGKAGKSGRITSVISEHNIQVQFSNGEIEFFCLKKGCPEYQGENISIFKG